MRNRVFVDSNIWLYLFLQDDDKKYKMAEQYFLSNNLNSIFVTSYQVINEVSNILYEEKPSGIIDFDRRGEVHD